LHPKDRVAIRRVRDLEIDQDLAFERRSQRVERIGTWIMVGILVAAALGVLGSGPLSHASVRAGEASLDYQRFSRYQSSETLTLHVPPAATPTPEVRVWVDRAYLEGSRLESVLPLPVRVEGAADRLVFVLAVAEPGRPLTVRFALQPERLGPVRGAIGVEGAGGPALTFRQVVFP
jgi:hypothetical protein